MTRSKWNGRTITSRTATLVAQHGRTCWLCGHTITHTVSIDHVHPVSTHPHLEHDPTNWRPAHLHNAGNPSGNGCHVDNCTCPGNTGRKNKPWTTPPSRQW